MSEHAEPRKATTQTAPRPATAAAPTLLINISTAGARTSICRVGTRQELVGELSVRQLIERSISLRSPLSLGVPVAQLEAEMSTVLAVGELLSSGSAAVLLKGKQGQVERQVTLGEPIQNAVREEIGEQGNRFWIIDMELRSADDQVVTEFERRRLQTPDPIEERPAVATPPVAEAPEIPKNGSATSAPAQLEQPAAPVAPPAPTPVVKPEPQPVVAAAPAPVAPPAPAPVVKPEPVVAAAPAPVAPPAPAPVVKPEPEPVVVAAPAPAAPPAPAPVVKPEPEPVVAAAPAPVAPPAPAPAVKPEPEPVVAAAPAPVAPPAPKPVVKPEPEPVVAATPAPVAPPAPKPIVKPEPEPVVAAAPAPVAPPAPKPVVKPEPEPVVAATPAPVAPPAPAPVVKPEPKPVVAPAPAPAPTPVAKPEPKPVAASAPAPVAPPAPASADKGVVVIAAGPAEQPPARQEEVKGYVRKTDLLRAQFQPEVERLDLSGLFVCEFGMTIRQAPETKNVVISDTQRITELLLQGNGYRRSGSHGKALECYRELTDMDPSNADFRFLLAKTLATLGREEEAIDSFIRARELGHEGARKEIEDLKAAGINSRRPLGFLRFWKQ